MIRRPLTPAKSRTFLVNGTSRCSIVGLLAPIPVGIPRAVAMAALMISAFAIGAVWFRSLFIVLDRVHQWSLARPELGDWRRVLAFYATLLGYAAASFAILFGILVTADRLT